MKLFKNNPFFVLINQVVTYGKIDPRKFFVLFFFSTRALMSLPFYFLQYFLYSKKIKRTNINKPPIFILGHYRSGTTLLHKLLTSDKRFGYLTNYDILCPNSSLILGKKISDILQRVINFFKIKNYHFNNSIHMLNDPGEEDMFLVSRGSPNAAYWGFVFPLYWNKFLNTHFKNEKYLFNWRKEYMQLIKQISFQNNGKQLVLKSPPNTGRVSQLLEDFPNAKFIYIHRNPFTLYYSMKNLWKRAIIKYYSLQKISEPKLEDIIFSHYKNLIEQYEEDKKFIPEKNLIEIEFEKLVANPFEVIKSIYYYLDFPEFELIRENLKKQLELEKKYSKFNYQYDKKIFDVIEKRWDLIITRRKYNKSEIIV